MTQSSFNDGQKGVQASSPDVRAARIRELNDQFRLAGPIMATPNRWHVTQGVDGLGPHFVSRVVAAVRDFTAFETDNDPYGEHDFGSLVMSGERIFWKIDYYDTSLTCGSPDPADPAVTTRVLTIMLASEY